VTALCQPGNELRACRDSVEDLEIVYSKTIEIANELIVSLKQKDSTIQYFWEDNYSLKIYLQGTNRQNHLLTEQNAKQAAVIETKNRKLFRRGLTIVVLSAVEAGTVWLMVK
jgi:hypothetical protein